MLNATLGVVRVRMQVDIGFGNAVEPPANDVDYPTLLDSPAPSVRAYPREAVVAEKLHALVLFGELNTRLKDFYDLYTLALKFSFDGEPLARSIAATFERRRTRIEAALPAALAPGFFADVARAERWRAYLTRNGLPGAPKDLAAAGELIRAFLGPLWRALVAKQVFVGTWPLAGPWTRAGLGRDVVP